MWLKPVCLQFNVYSRDSTVNLKFNLQLHFFSHNCRVYERKRNNQKWRKSCLRWRARWQNLPSLLFIMRKIEFRAVNTVDGSQYVSKYDSGYWISLREPFLLTSKENQIYVNNKSVIRKTIIFISMLGFVQHWIYTFPFLFKMSAVERYAIRFLESSGNYITLEQIKAAKVSN